MIFASAALITFVPRFLTDVLGVVAERRRWRLPATPALIFPVAVSLKRFLAPDFVFGFRHFSAERRSPVLWVS